MYLVDHNLFECGFRFFKRHAYICPLAENEPVDFDDDGCAFLVHVPARLSVIGKYLELGGRDSRLVHESLGERFRGLYLRGGFRRAPYPKSALLECINNAARKRILRPYHREGYFLFFCKVSKLLKVHYVYRHVYGDVVGTAVAGCYVYRAYLGRLRKFPSERVLPRIRSHNEYVSAHTQLVECALAAAGMPCCRGLVHALSTRALLRLFVVCFHRLFEPKAHFTTGHRLQYTPSPLPGSRQSVRIARRPRAGILPHASAPIAL